MRERQRRYEQSDKGRAAAARYQLVRRARHPEKVKARAAVNNAVRDGYLMKPEKCGCGGSPVEAHHVDYTKPLDVAWLCGPCHRDVP
jgi:hypothetical protein